MSVDILDGVLGLEAVHSVGSIALNDRTVDPRSAVRYYVDHIGGLHDLPEKDDNRTPRTGRKGEQVFSGQLRGKNITYEGRVQAPTLQLLRRAVRAARTAFATESDLVVQVSPQAAYGGLSWRYSGRVAAWVCDDNQQNFPAGTLPTEFQRAFTLTVRQDDPRYYAQPQHDSGPHNSGDTVTVTNAGDIDSELWITGDCAGPSVAVVIRNLTAPTPDAGIGLKTVPAGTVGWYSYDRSITLNGNPRPDLYDDSAVSDWWTEDLPTLIPGDNSIQVTGLANWHALWYDASV